MTRLKNSDKAEASTTRPWMAWGPSIVVLCVGLAVLIVGPTIVRNLMFARDQASIELASKRLETDNPLTLLNQATRDVAATVEPSVVHVSTAGSLGAVGSSGGGFYTSTGSGWVYDDAGHVITNAHVVAPAETIQVQLSTGEIRPATFIGSDVRSDIAVVKISPIGLHPAQRSSELPEQGDLVFAFGSPFDFRFSMSSGIVSGLSRTADLAELDFENFIQVDAAVNPGNSGGPLSDIYGRVIGMNTAIATGSGRFTGEGQFAGIGLAIPMRMIELVVDQLIESGEVSKGYLGIEMSSIAQLKLNRRLTPALKRVVQEFDGVGVPISGVPEGHPADGVGIRQGDVLLAVNGVEVLTVDNVRAQIGLRRPNSQVELLLWRWDEAAGGSRRVTVEVELGHLDPEQMYVGLVEQLRLAGLRNLVTLTRQLAETRSIEWTPGVIVLDRAESRQLNGVIEPETIIDHVGGDSISSEEDLYARLSQFLDSPRVRGRPLVIELGVRTPSGERANVLLQLR